MIRATDIYKQAIETYGIDNQKEMAKEECAELINALAKEKRHRASADDIISEIADVMIMCEQLALIYGPDEVMRMKQHKQCRLLERLHAAKGHESKYDIDIQQP